MSDTFFYEYMIQKLVGILERKKIQVASIWNADTQCLAITVWASDMHQLSMHVYTVHEKRPRAQLDRDKQLATEPNQQTESQARLDGQTQVYINRRLD